MSLLPADFIQPGLQIFLRINLDGTHRVNSFRNNGQNKSDQLFTVDRLCSGHSLFLSNQNMRHKKVFGLSSSIEYFIKSNFSLLFL